MATIKFKRGSGQPTGLTAYEPAWDTTNNRLFVNNGTTAMWVGALVVQDTTLAGNCAYYIPTQNSVKTYVDNSVSAGAVSSVNGATGAVTIGGGTAIAVATSTAARGITITNTGVWSVNGVTGTISNIAVTNAAQSFTGLQQFVNGISSAGGTFYGTQTFVNGATFSAITNFTAGLCASGACFSGNAIFVGGSAVRFIETGGGTHYVGLVGPTAITTEFNLTLPNSAGSAGQALVTDGAGLLSWSSSVVAASVGVTSDSGNLSTRYLVFTDTAGSAKTMYIDDGKTPLSYIPDSGLLSVGGNLIVAGNQIGISGATVYPIVMSGGASGNITLGAATSSIISIAGDLGITGGRITTGKNSADVFTLNALTVNAFNSATSLTIGNTGTSATTTNLMLLTGNTSANTLNIGTGITSGGKLDVNIGNSTATTGNINLYGNISGSGNISITGTYSGNVVRTVNGFTAGVTLAAGTGISVSNSSGTITIANTGVASVAGLTGNVGITGTANQINTTISGQTLTIALPNAVIMPGSLTITGDLTVNGTTTTVNATTVTVQDPLIAIGGLTGNIPPAVGDLKDRGIVAQYRNTSNTAGLTGFFGIDQSSGSFTYVPNATVSGEIISGLAGTATFGVVESDVSSLILRGSGSGSKATLTLAGATVAGDEVMTANIGLFSITNPATTGGKIRIESSGATSYTELQVSSTTNRIITFPNHTGTVVAPATLGTAGFVLYSNGAAAQPTWANPNTLAAGSLVTAEANGTYYLAMAGGVAAGGTAFYLDTTATALTYVTSTGTLTCSFVEATVDGGGY